MIKIWAHRGCSLRYPENTLTAFRKAMEIPGLTGIELDVQLTLDGELVVIHDETVDRTTDGHGFVRDYTLSRLKEFRIDAGDGKQDEIPTMREVFSLLQSRMKDGLLLNIELKNSVYPYPGMEEKILTMAEEFGVEESIVYSTFYARSLDKLYRLNPDLQLAILDSKVSDCIYKIRGGCKATMLHPFWQGIDLPAEELKGYSVRAWMSGYLYPSKPSGKRLDLDALEKKGITDIILNEPEVYLA